VDFVTSRREKLNRGFTAYNGNIYINVGRKGCIAVKISKVKVKFKVTLRLAVYRQSVRLGVKSLETYDHNFFPTEPCGNSPYVTSSLTRRWVCLY
jgi:hypothetical protein